MHSYGLLVRLALADHPYHAMRVKPHLEGVVMSLQARLYAFTAEFKGGKASHFAPPEFHSDMERAAAELVASG